MAHVSQFWASLTLQYPPPHSLPTVVVSAGHLGHTSSYSSPHSTSNSLAHAQIHLSCRELPPLLLTSPFFPSASHRRNCGVGNCYSSCVKILARPPSHRPLSVAVESPSPTPTPIYWPHTAPNTIVSPNTSIYLLLFTPFSRPCLCCIASCAVQILALAEAIASTGGNVRGCARAVTLCRWCERAPSNFAFILIACFTLLIPTSPETIPLH